MEKNSYERRVYESVGDRSLSYVISRKLSENRIRDSKGKGKK